MFNIIEKEITWRKYQGLPEGFEAIKRCKPLVAVGAEGPLGGQTLMADYYHGIDGLGNVHHTHPHHSSPRETWVHLFDAPPAETLLSSTAIQHTNIDPTTPTPLFKPSHRHSYQEILRILDTNPPDTITLIAIGPLTNFALAASESPQTFMKAKNVLVMGGTIAEPGNITPVGEFNCIADANAAARVYALTSPTPASTMPPDPTLPPYPSKAQLGSKRLQLTMFPLDITSSHVLRRDQVEAKTKPLIEKKSPLAEWVHAFLDATFKKSESLYHGQAGLGGGASYMCLHDIVCIWYALTSESQEEDWTVKKHEDIRVETQGQWTRGMCVVDRREMKMLDVDVEGQGEGEGEVKGDAGGWLQRGKGNRVDRCVGTPGDELLAPLLLDRVFG
ncbi:hypothetical protein N7G274_004605 [Stereocaulon virgatum]|uniref:Inosine/uridine-preferring nucleoside hydrolase domain-containing protein n=1 Tax=Stereocaulon virgatum TaxID=373712 RepID=A0ABR4AAP9_9LECA